MPKPYFDLYESQRKTKSPNVYCTDNFVLFYGAQKTNVTQQNIIDMMNTIESYVKKISTDFGLQLPQEFTQKRFPVYLAFSGFNPFPVDPPEGVVGAGGESMMLFIPDVFTNINKDQSTLIHELGHAMFRVNGKVVWLEESLCEYLVSFYLPTYYTIYDSAKSFIMQNTYKNFLCEAFRTSLDRYDFPVFWRFIEYAYGGHKTVAKIANNAFKVLNSDTSYWNEVAACLGVKEADLIVNWVFHLLQVKFWRDDLNTFKMLKKRYGKTSPLSPHNLVWIKATASDIDVAKARLQQGGFEVLSFSHELAARAASISSLKLLFIIHYSDKTAEISLTNTPNPAKSVKTCLVALVKTHSP
jgi:hypothetical protein